MYGRIRTIGVPVLDYKASLSKQRGYWRGILTYTEGGRRKQKTCFLRDEDGQKIKCDSSPVERDKSGHAKGMGGKTAEEALEAWLRSVVNADARAEADAERARQDREEAERAEAERIATEAEDARTGRNKTVSKALDEYIADGTKADSNGKARVARSTANTYHNIRKRIDRVLGDVRLVDLTTSQVKSFEDGMTEDGVGASVIEKTHMLLSAVCKSNIVLGVLARNPCDGIKHAHPVVKNIAASAEEIARINAGLSARDPEGTESLTIAVRIALGTGMREGEVCGLRWGDIVKGDKGTTIRLVRSIGREGGQTFVKVPKSEEPRHIPITDELARILAKRRERMRAEAWEAGFMFTPDYYVTGNADGSYQNPMTLGKAWRAFADVLRVVGIDKWGKAHRLTFHGLRHSFAVAYLRHNNYSDTAYNELRAILGHSSIYVTLNVYARPDTDAMREGINNAAESTERIEDGGARVLTFLRNGTEG